MLLPFLPLRTPMHQKGRQFSTGTHASQINFLTAELLDVYTGYVLTQTGVLINKVMLQKQSK